MTDTLPEITREDVGFEGPVWDGSGAYLAAATRLMRAEYRGTGCHLTPDMVRALVFAEADGDWWSDLREHLAIRTHILTEGQQE